MRVEQEKRGSAHGFPPHDGPAVKILVPIHGIASFRDARPDEGCSTLSRNNTPIRLPASSLTRGPLGTTPFDILRHALTGLARHLTIANTGTGAIGANQRRLDRPIKGHGD
ncbi:hypothetical protein [Brucella pituitosa]|uniref:hypothetical protein n=1 Tax=Brucella pituitosa TaxID=571256 RepID=UPI000FE1CCED|nr:hypothetical protein [Brucella pituitosa]